MTGAKAGQYEITLDIRVTMWWEDGCGLQKAKVPLAVKVLPEPQDPPPAYRMFLEHVNVKAGAKASARMLIEPINGWKWNDKYPEHSVQFASSSKRVELAKVNFEGADFQVGPEVTTIEVPFVGKSAGSEAVPGKFKVGLCDEVCKNFEGPVTVQVRVE